MPVQFLGYIARTDGTVGGHLYVRVDNQWLRISRLEKGPMTVIEFLNMQDLVADIRGQRSAPGLVFIDVLSAAPFTQASLDAIVHSALGKCASGELRKVVV